MTLLIRFRERFLTDTSFHAWRWAEVIPKMDEGKLITEYKRISDRSAQRKIRSNGLVLCEKDNTMQIWDTPERDFQKEYAKKIIVKDL